MADTRKSLPNITLNKKELPSLPNVTLNKNELPSLPNVTLNKNELPSLPSLPSLPNITNTANKDNDLFIADFNDPTQINSILDAVFSKDRNAMTQLIKNTFNPLLHKDEKGRWDPKLGIFVLNNLIHAGEILDVFANPLKGLFMEGIEGFKKTINWDGTGRYNFYYDLNPDSKADGIINFALEVISDPINWFTFGSSGAIKSIAKKGVSESIENITPTISRAVRGSMAVAGRPAAANAVKESVEQIVNAIPDIAKHTASEVANSSVKFTKKAFGRKFMQNLTTYATKTLNLDGKSALVFYRALMHKKKIFTNTLLDTTTTLLDIKTISLLSSIKKVYKFSTATDKFVLKTALTPSGIYPGYLLVKNVPKLYRGIAKQIIDKKLVAILDDLDYTNAPDAASAVRHIKNEIDNDPTFIAAIERCQRGEITEQEIGSIVCDGVAKQVKLIKDALYKNIDNPDLPVREIINKQIKDSVGIATLDDYITYVSSLKEIVDVEHANYINQLTSLRTLIEKVEARNEIIKAHTAEVKVYNAALDEYNATKKSAEDRIEALQNHKKNFTQKKFLTEYDEARLTEPTDLTYSKTRLEATARLEESIKYVESDEYANYAYTKDAFSKNKNPSAFYSSEANAFKKALASCDTIEEVKELIALFDKFTKSMRKILTNKAIVEAGNGTLKADVYMAALDSFWTKNSVRPGFERLQYARTYTQFTEDNIRISLSMRAYREYLVATAQGLKGSARLNYIKNNLTSWADTLLKDGNAYRARALPELLDVLDDYSKTLQKQITQIFDEASPKTAYNTLETKIKNIQLNTDKFNEILENKIKDIDTRIFKLEKYIDKLEPPVAPTIKLPKTAIKASEEIDQEALKAIQSADEILTLVKSIKSNNIVCNELSTASIEAMRNNTEFIAKTTNIVKFLNNFNDDAAYIAITKSNKNLAHNVVDNLAYKISNAQTVLNKFATGKTISFEELMEAKNTLIEVYELYEKFCKDNFSHIYTLQGCTEYFPQIKAILNLSSENKKLVYILEKVYKDGWKINEKKYIRQVLIKHPDLENQLKEALDNAMQTYADYIEFVNPVRIRGEQVRIAADAKYYQMKAEQVLNISAYTGNVKLVNTVTEMCTPGCSFHDVLASVAYSDSPYAQAALELLEFGNNFLRFVETLGKLRQLETDGVLTMSEYAALRSTLERQEFATEALMAAQDTFDETFFNELVDKMQDFYNYSYVYSESFSQEKILARDLAKGEDSIFAKHGFTKIDHGASSDAKFTYIARTKMLKVPDEYSGRPLMSFDIETTDTTHTAYIREAGIYDGEIQYDFIRTFESEAEASHYMPLYTARLKSYSELPTDAARKQAFYKQHIVQTPGTAPTAKEYYESFINALFSKGDDTVLIVHNGIDFDRPKLLRAFVEADVDPVLIAKFENAPILDNLIDFRREAGYLLELDIMKKEAVAKILREHMESMSNYCGLSKFFDAHIPNLRHSITDVLGYNAGKFKPAVDDIAEDIAENVANKVPASIVELQNYVSDLKSVLDNVKKEAPGTVYIGKNELPLISKQDIAHLTRDDITDEFKTFIKEIYGDDFDVEAYISEYLQKLGTDTTTTKLLHNNPQPIYPFGVRLQSDINKALDWFVLEDNTFIDRKFAAMYTTVGERLENLYSKLRNVPQLQDEKFVAKLQEFIDEVKLKKLDNKSNKLWVTALRTDVDNPAAKLTVGVEFYNCIKGNIPEDMVKKYDDIIQLLSFTNVSFKAKEIALPTNVNDYTDVLKMFKDAEDLDEALFLTELVADANKAFTSKHQLTNNALKATREFIEAEYEYMRNVDPRGKPTVRAYQKKLLDKCCIAQTKQILSQTPEELQSYMLHNRTLLMFLQKDDADIMHLIKVLQTNKDAYKKASIEFFENDEIFAVHFSPGTKVDYFVDKTGHYVTLNGERMLLDYSNQRALNVGYFRTDQRLKLEALFKQMGRLTNGQSTGHLGTLLSDADIEKYFALLPEELTVKLNMQEFTKSTMSIGFRFDAMNIGTLASRQRFNEYMPSDITRVIANNNYKIINRAQQSNLMLDYVLDSNLLLSNFIKQFGEEAVVNKVKNGDYTVMAVMQDKALKGKGVRGQGYRVIEFNPGNKAMWELAKDPANKAVIVPRTMYNDFYNTLNTSLLIDKPFYKVLHSLVYLTKLGQITTVGNFYRNTIEAQMKTMIETKDVLGTIRNNFKATRDIKAYKKAVCEILQLSEIDYDKLIAKNIDPQKFATSYITNRIEAEAMLHGYYDSLKDVLKMDKAKLFLPSNKKLYFEQINKSGIDEATFDTMHALLSETNVLGKLPGWDKYAADLHNAKQARYAQEYMDDLIGPQMLDVEGNALQQAYDGMCALGSLLLTPTQYMDRVSRVAMYLTLTDNGFVNANSAIGRVTRTMFDWGTKTDSERLIELVIPFYSFFKHNALYWAEAVEENPWLAKMFSDYINRLQSEAEVGYVSDYEKLHNVTLQNAKLAGNLILSSSNERVEREIRISQKGNPYYVDVTKRDDQVTLKLNFPFMEAYQMASNPIAYLSGATNPAIQLALQTWVGNNPNVSKGVATMLDTYRPYSFDEGSRADLQWYTIIPFIGPTLQRWGPDGYAKKQYEETGFLGNLILPSVFGRVNRFNDAAQFVGMVNQPTQYKKSYAPRVYTKRYSGPVQTKTAYTKTNKPKIKTYNPNYYNKYNYNQRMYINPYNHNKIQTYYTNKAKFYPYRVPSKPRPSVYKMLYNSYGKSRLQYLGLPRKVKNGPYALRKYFNYTR
jgi:hypothetical protein